MEGRGVLARRCSPAPVVVSWLVGIVRWEQVVWGGFYRWKWGEGGPSSRGGRCKVNALVIFSFFLSIFLSLSLCLFFLSISVAGMVDYSDDSEIKPWPFLMHHLVFSVYLHFRDMGCLPKFSTTILPTIWWE
jgi:hypothetical protein